MVGFSNSINLPAAQVDVHDECHALLPTVLLSVGVMRCVCREAVGPVLVNQLLTVSVHCCHSYSDPLQGVRANTVVGIWPCYV